MKLVLTLWLLAITSLSVMSEGTAGEGSPAELIGFHRGASTLLFTVISQGCTIKKDFRLDVDHSQENAITVTLIRLKTDRCKRLPVPIELAYTVEESLATKNRLRVTNQFVSLVKRTQ